MSHDRLDLPSLPAVTAEASLRSLRSWPSTTPAGAPGVRRQQLLELRKASESLPFPAGLDLRNVAEFQ